MEVCCIGAGSRRVGVRSSLYSKHMALWNFDFLGASKIHVVQELGKLCRPQPRMHGTCTKERQKRVRP